MFNKFCYSLYSELILREIFIFLSSVSVQFVNTSVL